MRTLESNGQDRLLGAIQPMTIRRNGDIVEVYVGCGWSKGIVTMSLRDRCSVRLSKAQRTVTCYDDRNIRATKAQ